MEFKVGDKVRITETNCYCYNLIGEIIDQARTSVPNKVKLCNGVITVWRKSINLELVTDFNNDETLNNNLNKNETGKTIKIERLVPTITGSTRPSGIIICGRSRKSTVTSGFVSYSTIVASS